MKNKRFRKTSFILDEEDYDNLKILAMTLGGISVSEIIRIAIRYHLTKNASLIKDQKKLLEKNKELIDKNKGELE